MENSDHDSPQTQVLKLLTSKMASQALTVVAEFGVPDQLKAGPRAVSELANTLELNQDALYRMLRALVGMGFFVEHPGHVFANNAASEVLCTDAPGSLRAMARWLGEESSWWKAWGNMSHCLRTGKPATEVAFGTTAFEFFSQRPRVKEIFQGAMTDFSVLTARAVVEAYDFAGAERIVDVGGGHGTLLSTILAVVPGASGVLYDLPEVLDGADATLKTCGQLGRVEKVAGSFFESVPEDADVYIMKHIIHDWDDARCVQLLKNCRQAMRPGGRVLIVEQVIGDGPASAMGKLVDLEMLVMTPGGRERTEAEFRQLLRKAGFELQRVVRTESPVCVIEALASKTVEVHTKAPDPVAARQPVAA